MREHAGRVAACTGLDLQENQRPPCVFVSVYTCESHTGVWASLVVTNFWLWAFFFDLVVSGQLLRSVHLGERLGVLRVEENISSFARWVECMRNRASDSRRIQVLRLDN